MERSKAADHFLTGHGWGGSKRSFLAGDCSFRRYERVVHADASFAQSAILMDAPPPEDPERFVFIANLLQKLDFCAPDVYAQDLENGFLLLEDFGDNTYNALLKKGHNPLELYQEAVDLLVALHQSPTSLFQKELSFFDLSRFLKEIEFWTDWYYPAVQGEEMAQALKEDFLGLWSETLAPLEKVFTQGRACLVLRDYHVDNIIRLADEEEHRICGLLDFQDAVYGPMAYDLVSLLEDARRDVDPFFAARLKKYYLNQQSLSFDKEAFNVEYLLLRAQRATKVIGIFTRLAFRDKKPHTLPHIQRVWGYLNTALAHPLLAPLQKIFDETLPLSSRITPSLEKAA